jgi:hypothetical protein
VQQLREERNCCADLLSPPLQTRAYWHASAPEGRSVMPGPFGTYRVCRLAPGSRGPDPPHPVIHTGSVRFLCNDPVWITEGLDRWRRSAPSLGVASR